MNPDGHNFTAYCQECERVRSVSCSRSRVATHHPIRVGAIVCGHAWDLNVADGQKVRQQIHAAA